MTDDPLKPEEIHVSEDASVATAASVNAAVSRRDTAWYQEPFFSAIDYLLQLDRIFNLCRHGLKRAVSEPELHRALEPFQEVLAPSEKEEREKRLRQLEVDASVAGAEVCSGFPTIGALALVSLWGAVDSAIFDLAVAWLKNVPSALSHKQYRKVKFTLDEYQKYDEDARYRYLVNLVRRDLSTESKAGIDKHEVLLDTLGLSDQVDSQLRKTCIEAAVVRNLIVHCRSIVDYRAITACPWKHWTTGEQLVVNTELYAKYSYALMEYLYNVMARVYCKHGRTLPPYKHGKSE